MLPNRPYNTPSKIELLGSYVNLYRLTENDIAELYACFSATADSSWDYLFYGPFKTLNDFTDFINQYCLSNDPYFYCVRDKVSNEMLGMLSLMRIDTKHGCIEIGHIHLSDKLKATTKATESIFLLLQYSFELGHRRLEWKCNNANKKSKQAALRFGFTAEGVFRQHMITKGKNRDTAWFSIIDSEWNHIKNEFNRWLDPNNFKENGQQKTKLEMIK